MAVMYIDGFDSYSTTSDLWSRWSNMNGTPSLGSTNTRFNVGKYLIIGQNQRVVKSFASRYNRLCVGFSFRCSALPGGTPVICALRDESSVHVDMRLNTSGFLSVTRNGAHLASSSSTIAPNTWYHIGFDVYIHGTAGTAIVYLNGDSVITLSSANTKNSSLDANNVVIGTTYDQSQQQHWFDDLYITNTSGDPQGYLGDCRIETLRPSAAGDSTQWTPSSGANWECVDEDVANDDSDYVSSLTSGQKDLYHLTNLSNTPDTIYAVQPVIRYRKTGAGTRRINLEMKSGTSIDWYTVLPACADGYTSAVMTFSRVPPSNQNEFTPSQINDLQIGVSLAN